MPDNNPNWEADNGFWDAAWQDMRGQLDREMPVRKKRRGLPVWWLAGVGLAVLGWWVNGVVFGPEPTGPFVVTSIAHPDEEELGRETGDLRQGTREQAVGRETRELKQGTQEQAVGRETRDLRRETQEQAVGRETRDLRHETQGREFGLETMDLRHETQGREFGLETMDLRQETQGREFGLETMDLRQETRNRELDVRNKLHLPAVIPTLDLRVNYDRLAEVELPYWESEILPRLTVTPKIIPSTRNAYFVEAFASHGSRAPGFGYGFDLGVLRKAGAKSDWSLSLGFRAAREQFDRPSRRDEDLNSQAPISEDSTGLSGNEDAIDLIARAKENGTNYVTTYRLRVALGYERRMGKRFSAGPQLGLTYLLYGEAPAFLGNLENNGIVPLTGNAAEFNLDQVLNAYRSFDNLSAGAFNGGGSSAPLATRRWGVDLGIRFGYRLSERWQLFGTTHYQLRPVLRTESLVVDRWRGRFGVRFRL